MRATAFVRNLRWGAPLCHGDGSINALAWRAGPRPGDGRDGREDWLCGQQGADPSKPTTALDRFTTFCQTRGQDQSTYLAIDMYLGRWDLYAGIGKGYGGNADHLILKFIISVPLTRWPAISTRPVPAMFVGAVCRHRVARALAQRQVSPFDGGRDSKAPPRDGSQLQFARRKSAPAMAMAHVLVPATPAMERDATMSDPLKV